MANQDRIEKVEDGNAADQLIDDRQEEVEVGVARLASVSVQILEKFEEHVERGNGEETDDELDHFVIENLRLHTVLYQPGADHARDVGVVVEKGMKIGLLEIRAVVEFQFKKVIGDHNLVTMNEEERKCRDRTALDGRQQEAKLWPHNHVVDYEEVQDVADEKRKRTIC